MKPKRLRLFTIVFAVGSTLVGAGLTVGSGHAAASATATVYPASAQGVVSPTHARPPAQTSPSSSTLQRGARRQPRTSGAAATNGGATAASSSATVSSSLLHNFNGVSSLDSQLTNFNARFEPPDQGLCEGNGFVLEAVNSAYTIYHTNGSKVEGPFNVNDLFDEGSEEFTSDPRCHFDATTNTWFASILFISADSQSSHLDIAVNSTGDPTNFWTEYRFDTTDNGGNGCPCFGDQERIGIDQYNLYVSQDEFSILGPQFNGGQLYAISKSDLVAGNPAHFFTFNHLHLGGQKVFAVEPALSIGSPNAEYFLNTFDPNGTFDNRVGVWAMTRRSNVAGGVAPILSSLVIGSQAYGLPVPPIQRGSSLRLDGGDDRMQQTEYISGDVWGELTTAVTIPGDSAERDGAAWFRVHPSLNGDVLGGATIPAQGYVTKSGNYLIYPAFMASWTGRAAMVFTETGSSLYPSAAYAVMGAGQTHFSAPIIAASGTGPYHDHLASTRWGDYSWALMDLDGRFWLATEYVPPASSQTTNGDRNWGTRVLEVSVSS